MKFYHTIILSFTIFLGITACKKDKEGISGQELRVFNEAQATDISFCDNRNGYISGSYEPSLGAAVVAKTSDGGEKWVEMPVRVDNVPATIVRSIAVKDKNHVFATFNTRDDYCGVCKSNDGGSTWQSTFKTSNLIAYHGLVLRESDAFVCRGGQILKSTDDCVTWKVVYSNEGFFGGFFEPVFTSRNIGYAHLGHVGDSGGAGPIRSSGILIKTEDAGESWSKLESIRDCITSLVFRNDKQGFAFTFDGNVLQTNDGALTWKPLTTIEGVYFSAIINQNSLFYTNGGSSLYQSDFRLSNIKDIYKDNKGNSLITICKISGSSVIILTDKQYIFKIDL